MIMRRHLLILFTVLATFLLPACERKDEPNKIIEGLPVSANQTNTLATLVQQFHIAGQRSLAIVVSVINRLPSTNRSFPEFTSGPDGQTRYTFALTDSHFGSATGTVQFQNESAVAIDPIAAQTSTTSIKFVEVALTGSSDEFSYTLNYTITLETAGLVDSNKTLSNTTAGTNNFNGSGHNLDLTFSATKAPRANFLGVIAGEITGSGTDSSGAISMTLTYSSDNSADGIITWAAQTAGIHLKRNGDGFIVTDTARIIFD